MAEFAEKTIYVDGKRPKPSPELGDYGGGFSPFVPQFIYANDWQLGQGGSEVAKRVEIFKEDGNLVFRLTDIGINIRIPLNEWQAMNDGQRRTLTYALEHYMKSDQLILALEHYVREGVTEIEIRFGTTVWSHDGTSRPFEGRQAAIVAADRLNDDGTDLRPGSKIVISFNSNDANRNLEFFAVTIVHELLHPWVPDTWQNGQFDDHDRVDELGVAEWRKMIGRGRDAYNLAPGAEIGVGYLGSRHADTDIGTIGNDVMAGMGGNDVLDGMGGNDLLAGGTGMDTLIAGTGFSDLRGGLDADTYVASQPDANFYVEDAGGVDRLVVMGSSTLLLVTRNGNNLSIWSSGEPFAYEIVDHYVDGKRIEIFQFSDGEYSASYLEYLAESAGGGPGVCYQDGYPVICGNYGMPVVIDLGGDGVRLVEANKSRVRWDVDGDGKAERVGWTDGKDAFLVLDRNGNGSIDSFSELSFLSDFRGAGSDLEGLLAYDDNGDGFISEADEIYARLQLWQDANCDGVSQPHELVSLAAAGILSIGLEIRDLRKLDQSEPMNQVLGWSEVSMSDGKVLKAFDVGFYYKSRDDEWRMTATRDSQATYEPHEILVADLMI